MGIKRTITPLLSAAAILARLLTVDGAGSGLDADLLDGNSSAFFLPAASYTAADVLAKLITVDGAGSGLDADFLDGNSSAYFLPAASYTAADVLAKLLTVDGAGSGLDADLLDGNSSAFFLPAASYTAADVLAKLITVDGAGSGLDADLLDGNSSAFFLDAGNMAAGILAAARGGTGVSNAGTLTNASNTIITGGGTVALGGFTLTVPATGAAVLTTGAQSIGGVKTLTNNLNLGDGTTVYRFNINSVVNQTSGIAWQTAGNHRWLFYVTNLETGSDAGADLVFGRAFTDAGVGIDNPITITRAAGGPITILRRIALAGDFTMTSGNLTLNSGTISTANTTSASSSTVGAVVVGNGTAATSVGIGAGNINVGGTLVAEGGAADLVIVAGSNARAIGTFIAANAAAGTTRGVLIRTGGSNRWMAVANSASESGANAGSGYDIYAYTDAGVFIDTALSIVRAAGGLITLARPTSVTATTDATAIGTASVVQSGGQSTAKNILAGQAIAAGVTSTATAAGTTTLTNASRRTQIFTGVTTQTMQMPAANLFGAGVAVEFIIINRSTGSVTASRAGADTFVGGGTTDVITTLTQRYYVSDGVSVWYSFAI